MPAEVAHIAPSVPPPLPPGVGARPLPPPAERNPGLCANCDQPLHGPFCAHCGQHVNDIHRSVWRFVVDFFDTVFGWDTKVFRTLQPLVSQPGALTRDYLAGRRARYVHPLRLFLFTSAICLAIIQYFAGGPFGKVNPDPTSKPHRQKGLHIQSGDASPPPAPVASPAGTAAPLSAAPLPAAPSATPSAGKDGDDDDDDAANSKDVADALNRAADNIRQARAAASGEASAPRGEGLGDAIKRKVMARIQADGGTQRMEKEITENSQRRVSWVALALLPIFAAMLRGLYWRRESYYFAHFVFSLHYHTFLLLFFAACTLLQLVLPTSLWPVHALVRLSLLLPGVYLFLAMRRLYGEGRGRTFAKVCLLGALHLLALFTGLAIVGGLSLYHALG